MISLSVDGHPVEVESGASVLDAARKAGVEIPTLCHHDDLSTFGSCRLCIVEIEGRPGFPASCATRAEEGMAVQTDTEKVQQFRRQVLELLLSEHPSSCLVCSDRLSCWESHECTGRAEITTGCKFCPSHTRCELEDTVEQLYGKEGAQIRLPSRYRDIPVERRNPFIDQDDNLCILCGRCIRACAELKLNYTLDFVYRGSQERVGTPFNSTLADADCLFCGACIEVCPTGALSERVRRWEGAAEVTVPTTCSYCSTGCQLDLGVKDGSVIEALPRKDDGGDACLRGRFAVVEFVRSVRRLKSPLVRRNGQLTEVPWETALTAAAEGIKRARPERSALLYSGSCTNEDIYTAHRFARDVLQTSHVDSSLRFSFGPLLDADGVGGPIARVSELREAAAVLIAGADPAFSHPVLSLQLKRAVHEGRTRLVLMGPHATGLSSSAACEIRHAPGEERQVLEQLQQALSPAGDAELPEAVARAAEILQEAESVVIAFGSGLMRRLDGTGNRDAVARLAASLSAKLLPLFSDANDHGAREIAASFGCDGLTAPEILRSARDGELDLLYLVGQDAWPGSSDKAFVVVQDMFLSSGAAEIADVVLPAASFAEIDGSTTHMDGRLRRVRQAIPPLGTSKPDWEILSALAGKLEASGFDHSEPSKIMGELAQEVPFFKGTSYTALEKDTPFFGKPVAASKARRPTAAAPDRGGRKPASEAPDHDYPFALVAEFDEYTYKATPLSSAVPGLRRLERAPAVMINPADAGALGVGDDAPVSVISRRGRVAAKAQLSQATQQGVVRMVVRAGEASPAVVLHGLLDPASKTPDELCAVTIEKL